MLYFYEAFNDKGIVMRGDVEALSEHDVLDRLHKKGLSPISIRRAKGAGVGDRILSALSIFEGVSSADIVFMVRNLGVALRSGMSITEAFDILVADAEKPAMRDMLVHVRANLQGGKTLSDSFSAYLKYFPPIFPGMIKAGESSGELDAMFDEVGRYLYKEYSMEQKVKSALTYPIILLVASCLVVWFMLAFVMPRLSNVFTASGAQIPPMTQFFMSLGSFLSNHIILDVLAFGALIWFFTGFRATEYGKRFFYAVAVRIPPVRDLLKKVLLVRLARSLGNLLQSGITVTEALDLMSDAMGVHAYKVALDEATASVRTGIPLSQALTKHADLFTTIFLSLLTVGERTGTLGKTLVNFADFYEEDVDNQLKNLSSLLEPALLLIMGLLIGSIAFAILMPIYQIMGRFV
ncbi:MAG TPA: type II secretion system F family protein [Candidatus Paceibacterota bacterium]